MKKRGNIFVFVVAFFLGIFVCVLFFKFQGKEDNNVDGKLVLNILKEENNNLFRWAKRYLDESVKQTTDTTRHEILLLKNMILMSNYFNAILSSKEYNSFSIDTVQSILENSIRLIDVHEKIKQISFKNNTSVENEWYINLCWSIVLNRCFILYREHALMIGDLECVFVPKKDTIKIGDFYEAHIYLAIKDITQTYRITDTIDCQKIISMGDVYREKVTTKGLNRREVLLPFFNGFETICFPAEFSFYVK
jgi:hypothetical protein